MNNPIRTDLDVKLQAALKLYIDKHGMGALLDQVIRPVFAPDNLRVVMIKNEERKPTKP